MGSQQSCDCALAQAKALAARKSSAIHRLHEYERKNGHSLPLAARMATRHIDGQLLHQSGSLLQGNANHSGQEKAKPNIRQIPRQVTTPTTKNAREHVAFIQTPSKRTKYWRTASANFATVSRWIQRVEPC